VVPTSRRSGGAGSGGAEAGARGHLVDRAGRALQSSCAYWTRWWCSSAAGVVPVAARNRPAQTSARTGARGAPSRRRPSGRSSRRQAHSSTGAKFVGHRFDGARHVLGLAAVAVRRRHHAAGDVGGRGRAVRGADQVKAEIDARGGSGRREHRAVFDTTVDR
jgi:hypothetical protein